MAKEADLLDSTNDFQLGIAPALDMDSDVLARCTEMHTILKKDRELLSVYKDYVDGNHGRPVIPHRTDASAAKLAKRSRMNLIRLAVNIPAQVSYIDGYSREDGKGAPELNPPEWEVWHNSNMPAKQTRLFISSLTYGAGYTMLANPGTDKRRIDLLSARNTTAFFEDPVNDITPAWALTIKTYPRGDIKGRAIYMDEQRMVHLEYDNSGDFKILPNGEVRHGLGQTPCVRWPAVTDDEGNVQGVVGPMIASQDRINQTIFDLLNNQSFNAWKLRYGTGLVGEPMMTDDGMPVTDANGDQVYKPLDVRPSAFLTSPDADVRFGSLDETPQEGFIQALQEAVKDFAVEAQLPPHSLMGSMSNLSAETLQALMSQTMRFSQMLKGSWGDAARTQMQMVAHDMGIVDGVTPKGTEMRWRDMNENTMATIVDALGKGVQMLQIPPRAAWSRFPGVSDSELARWDEMANEQQATGWIEDQEDPSNALARETASRKPPQADAANERAIAQTPAQAAAPGDRAALRSGRLPA